MGHSRSHRATYRHLQPYQLGDWIDDSLLLLDLGYLDYARLAWIDHNGGWFMSRLNVDANPEIIDELRTWCDDTINLEGRHLQEVLPDLYRQIIDARGTVGADRPDPHLPYDVRVVGVRHEDDEDNHRTEEVEADHDYHLYATNLPADAFAPRELAALYSNRWRVETVVDELKTVFELDEMTVRRKAAVECFMMAALLMVLVSPISAAAGTSTARTRLTAISRGGRSNRTGEVFEANPAVQR